MGVGCKKVNLLVTLVKVWQNSEKFLIALTIRCCLYANVLLSNLFERAAILEH
jgi:hypothetical protein